METLKIVLSSILTILLVGFAINTMNVSTAKADMQVSYYAGTKECPSGKLVIRCDYGEGTCEAGQQKFCDEV